MLSASRNILKVGVNRVVTQKEISLFQLYLFFFFLIGDLIMCVCAGSLSLGCSHAFRETISVHSEGQCRSWRAVDYTGRPKAESPLSQGP